MGKVVSVVIVLITAALGVGIGFTATRIISEAGKTGTTAPSTPQPASQPAPEAQAG